MSVKETSTYIESFPEYLQALGSVSAEMAALELFLSHLFTTILSVQPPMGEAVFFAPSSTGVRIKMLEMAATHIPKRFINYKKNAIKIVEKARKYQNKRNDLLHSAWTANDDFTKIIKRTLPVNWYLPEIHTNVFELFTLVENIKQLQLEVTALTKLILLDPSYQPSPKKP